MLSLSGLLGRSRDGSVHAAKFLDRAQDEVLLALALDDLGHDSTDLGHGDWLSETCVKSVVGVSHVSVVVVRRLLDVVTGLVVVSLTVGNDVFNGRSRGTIVSDTLVNCRGGFSNLDIGVLSLSLGGRGDVQSNWKFFVSCSHEFVVSGNADLRATLILGLRGQRLFVGGIMSVTANQRSRSSRVESRWASDEDGAVIRDRPLVNLIGIVA